jgi:S-adenosylmethionine synthetase
MVEGMTDGRIAELLAKIFDLRPAAIVRRYGLKNPIFSETAAYGHFGRTPGTKVVDGKSYETFTWEKLDAVDEIRKSFGL